jgi:regulation of enolase protein 1 (concanavalin A-like superfamily)
MMTAQEKQQNFILKTNVLNFIIIPSVHLEFRIAEKSSVVLNFHRGRLVFFNENNWINASIDYKKYFSRKTNLTGFYLSPGITYNYDYDDVKLDEAGNDIKYGISSIGGIVRIGYQFGLNDHFIIDLGTGLVIDKEIESNYEDTANAELRLMAGVGYKF